MTSNVKGRLWSFSKEQNNYLFLKKRIENVNLCYVNGKSCGVYSKHDNNILINHIFFKYFVIEK